MDSKYWCPLSSFPANTDIGWFRESSDLITQVQVIVVSSFPSQFFLSPLREPPLPPSSNRNVLNRSSIAGLLAGTAPST
jgi:hypothetical protein